MLHGETSHASDGLMGIKTSNYRILIQKETNPTGPRGIKKDRAIDMKLWWRFREQSSLWATHIYSKYCRRTSPLALSTSSGSSPRLSRAWTVAYPHILWVLRKGNILFWDDIWLGDRPLREICMDDRGNPQARVSDFWVDGQWNLPKLQLLHFQAGLPRQVIEKIIDTLIVQDEQDTPRWSLSKSGQFTLASAWQTIRSQRPIIPALEETPMEEN